MVVDKTNETYGTKNHLNEEIKYEKSNKSHTVNLWFLNKVAELYSTEEIIEKPIKVFDKKIQIRQINVEYKENEVQRMINMIKARKAYNS